LQEARRRRQEEEAEEERRLMQEIQAAEEEKKRKAEEEERKRREAEEEERRKQAEARAEQIRLEQEESAKRAQAQAMVRQKSREQAEEAELRHKEPAGAEAGAERGKDACARCLGHQKCVWPAVGKKSQQRSCEGCVKAKCACLMPGEKPKPRGKAKDVDVGRKERAERTEQPEAGPSRRPETSGAGEGRSRELRYLRSIDSRLEEMCSELRSVSRSLLLLLPAVGVNEMEPLRWAAGSTRAVSQDFEYMGMAGIEEPEAEMTDGSEAESSSEGLEEEEEEEEEKEEAEKEDEDEDAEYVEDEEEK
jgi:hypothetical protein